MPSLRERILFFLGTSAKTPEQADVFTSSASGFSSLTYAQLSWLVGSPPPATLRSAVASLQRDGLVSTLQRGGVSRIRLTSVGREALLAEFPGAVFRRERWDERWRVLVFSGVREGAGRGERAGKNLSVAYRALRKELRQWGFAPVSRGVYVSPFSVGAKLASALAKSGLLPFCVGFESRRFFLGDEREFARKAWNLDVLSKEYAKLGSRVAGLLKGIERQNDLNESAKHQFSLLSLRMYQMLIQDSGLPSQVLPEDFQAQTCWQTYLRLASVVFTRLV